jgi:hypothetical protein
MLSAAAEQYFKHFAKCASAWEGSYAEFEKQANRMGFWQRLTGRGMGNTARATAAGPRTSKIVGDEAAAIRAKITDNAAHQKTLGQLDAEQAKLLTSERASQMEGLSPEVRALMEGGGGAAGQAAQQGSRGGAMPWVAGGLGTAAAGTGAYALGRNANNESNKTNRALAFGGGVATGLAAPRILQGVNRAVANQGLMPGYGGGGYDFRSI